MKEEATALQRAFLKEVAAHWPPAKGSLAFVRRPCIRANCPACLRGDKHGAWIFTFRQGGRQRCRYVSKELAPLLRRGIANGRWLEARVTALGVALIEERRRPARRGGGRAVKRQGRA